MNTSFQYWCKNDDLGFSLDLYFTTTIFGENEENWEVYRPTLRLLLRRVCTYSCHVLNKKPFFCQNAMI